MTWFTLAAVPAFVFTAIALAVRVRDAEARRQRHLTLRITGTC